MIRRRSDDDGGSLDSLLDTLTNVVGILVIVLVVTQMGVQDAVERLVEANPIDQAQVETARETAQQMEQQVAAARQSLEDLKPLDQEQFAARLSEIRRQAEEEFDTLRAAEQQREQAERKVQEALEKARRAATEARQQIEEDEEERDRLAQKLTEALEEVSRLEAILDDTPQRDLPPAKVVSLPNPRPAPEGAEAIRFVCAGNKVYPLDLDTLRSAARKRAEVIVQTRRVVLNPEEGIDADRFILEFNRTNLRDNFFDVTMTAAGRTPRLEFTPRQRGGFNVQAVENPRSLFRRQLEQVDRQKFYCRFFVQSDSFDIYVSARNVLAEYDLLAGWEPQAEDWTFRVNLGGPLRFGPEPKSPPAPRPATPSAPAPPPNVID